HTLAQTWQKETLTAEELAGAGLKTVSTHDEFVKLYESLDRNTERGRELSAILLNDVAPAFVDVQGSAQDAADELKRAADELDRAAESGLALLRQKFLSPQEQQQARIEDASTELYNFTKDGTRLAEVFKELNITVPT